MNFTEFTFSTELLEGISHMNFVAATPVQEQTIPIILEGKDIIACAQTGTGKTAAYLLPIINKLLIRQHTGTNTIILVPTRELAQQIDQQMEGFGYFLNVSSTAIYGGNSPAEFDRQRKAIESGVDIIISTPGRLLQHIEMGYVDFSNIQHFVLDEADRMLDMGFVDDIAYISKLMPQARQNILFSATMPVKIREFAKNIMHNPAEVSLSISKPAAGVTQEAYILHDAQKIPLLVKILKEKQLPSIIIFSSRKQKVKEIAQNLRRNKLKASEIHSDLQQNEREDVMREFRNKNVQILVATDIISRGIDVEKIDMVINFDVPRDAEDYVHRIGRTARAQTKGIAITFVNEEEQYAFGKIEKLIESSVPKAALPVEFGDAPVYNPSKPKGGKPFHKRGANPSSHAPRPQASGAARPQGSGDGKKPFYKKKKPNNSGGGSSNPAPLQ